MSTESTFALRRGRPGDALAILEAQHSAIEWPPPHIAPERVETFALWIERGEEQIVVALHASGQIIGFGSIVPRNSELRALYVCAVYGRQGVGSAILVRLETLAKQAGLSELRVDASINAVRFYEANGFTPVERGRRSSRAVCVRMRKPIRAIEN